MKNQNMSKYNNAKLSDANNKNVHVLNEFFFPTNRTSQADWNDQKFLYSCIFQLVAMIEGKPTFWESTSLSFFLSLREKRLQQEVLFYTIIFLYFHK